MSSNAHVILDGVSIGRFMIFGNMLSLYPGQESIVNGNPFKMNQMCITELEAPQLEPSAVKKCAVMHMWFLYEKKDFSCRSTQLVWDDHSLIVAWSVVSNEYDGSAGLKMQWYGIWIGDLPRLLMVKLEIPHEYQRDFIEYWWYYPLQQSSVSMCGIAQIICFFSWAGTPSLCSKLTWSGAQSVQIEPHPDICCTLWEGIVCGTWMLLFCINKDASVYRGYMPSWGQGQAHVRDWVGGRGSSILWMSSFRFYQWCRLVYITYVPNPPRTQMSLKWACRCRPFE